MLGFPVPYPEELLYSTVARAGVHDGDTSPKQLLDKVFNNRKIVATIDLPSHIEQLADQYPKSLNLGVATLISGHTLWPIYSPFLPAERKSKLKNWMLGKSQGAIHLSIGISASRIKTKECLYVCAECLKEQKLRYGECFWNRSWQIPLAKICLKHGPLNKTNIELNGEHRHSYIPVESSEILDPVEVVPVDKLFSQQLALLLRVENLEVSFAQWTAFYRGLASRFGFTNGSKVDHAQVHHVVNQFWGRHWLADANILPLEKETSWLKGLFRKHRKSFSHVEHIVAILALSNGLFNIDDAIKIASKLAIHDKTIAQDLTLQCAPQETLTFDQAQWIFLLNGRFPKQARLKEPALYARLYRNHHDWLMKADEAFHTERKPVNNRIDWSLRDRQAAKELRYILNTLSEDLKAPHLSKTFLIHQLKNPVTIEKNLHRLPRCSKLLSWYSENTSEYQARRLARAYFSMQENEQEIKRWSLLRQAGLSDERMTDVISELLKEILSG